MPNFHHNHVPSSPTPLSLSTKYLKYLNTHLLHINFHLERLKHPCKLKETQSKGHEIVNIQPMSHDNQLNTKTTINLRLAESHFTWLFMGQTTTTTTIHPPSTFLTHSQRPIGRSVGLEISTSLTCLAC